MLDVRKLHVEQSLQGFLGVIQLRLGQELGIAGYVGQDEKAFLYHSISAAWWAIY